MINLIVKNISDNSNKIDAIVNYINKTNKGNCFKFITIAAIFYTVAKRIEKQDEEINDLKIKIEELKSKGV